MKLKQMKKQKWKMKLLLMNKNHILKYLLSAVLLLSFSGQSFAFSYSYPALAASKHIFLIDQDTGEVLLEKNADARIAPSSMTKLMTAYVIFDQLKKGNIKLDNQCVIGKDAWKKKGSRMLLGYGDVVTVGDLLIGLLIASGNDAAVALAEATSGSIQNFAYLMNETGRNIGLKNSHFLNPHGLHEEGHYMSLRDLAIVTSRITSDFPKYLYYFSVPQFSYQNIIQVNHNPLIKNGYIGATGMKTGYTGKGGYGMVGTATRGSRRLIAVTNQARSSKEREAIITQLLDFGFDNYRKVSLFKKGQVVAEANVWLGDQDKIEMTVDRNIVFTIPKTIADDEIKIIAKYKTPLYTPISKDQEIGVLTVEIEGKKYATMPLYAKEDVDKLSYTDRIFKVTKYKVRQFLNMFK